MIDQPDRDLRVSLIQGDTLWHDPAGNRARYGEMMAPLRGQTDLIVLPETFTSGFSNEAIHRAEDMHGPTVAWLRDQASQLGAVVTGSVQIRDGGGGESAKVFNRLIWATPDGDMRAYDKRHLFRMAKEHERYAAGSDRLTLELNGWRICPLVCYDLRFPVFIRNRYGVEAADRFDYDLLVFVANWPSARGHAWRTLLPARAIENLSYVAAVNRVGRDGNQIDYSGDSVVHDFLGQPLVECGAQPQVVTATLSANALAEHGRDFPRNWMRIDSGSKISRRGCSSCPDGENLLALAGPRGKIPFLSVTKYRSRSTSMRNRHLIATMFFLVAGVAPITASAGQSGDRPIVAVAEFKNETSAGWWSGGVGRDLAGLLSNELSNTGSFKVVEREKLQSVMEEQNLMASGRAKLSQAAQIGKLTGAQYLVTGTVTSFEANTGHSGGGFSFGGVSIGGKKSEAYVAIDIRVIDTTTGDIDYSRTIEGTAKGGGSSVGLSGFWGGSTNFENEQNTPTGKAIRAAVIRISDYLDCVMVRKDSCKAKFDAEERRRRDKDTGALQLD